MHVLVTGSSGFIGLNTCDLLRTKGYEIHEVDKANESEPIDIRNLNRLNIVFSEFKPDVVIHLAALASVPIAEKNPFEAYSTNVIGTLNVVECANKLKTKVIFASSAAVYGEPSILPTPETSPLTPINVYGATKMAAENIVSLRARKWLIFRLFNVYGPKCHRSYVIPDIIGRIMQGDNPLRALGTGEEKRDFVYVSDVVRAFMLGIEKDVNGTFNIGYGKSIHIKDLITKMFDIAELKTQYSFAGSKRIGDFECNWADVSRIKKQLGWKPETNLEEGLRKTIKWYSKLN